MDSAAHSQKIFHCPTIVGNNAVTQDREFRTMSGLVQQIEDEACKVGKDSMPPVVGFLGPTMRKFNASITSLEK